MLSSLTHALLIWSSIASAQVVDKLSFGHKHGISENSFSIPGWGMMGEGYVPQLLSDKVILTPPHGGNKRGALWGEHPNDLHEWQATIDFRAGGVDYGRGNMQIWYVKNGHDAVSTSSVYTVGKFDGLALLIDTTGGVGKIRGFLNDGTIEYRNHPNVDGLAFGHCDYEYRNLGRPSKVEVLSHAQGLEVWVDDHECFYTDKVSLPSDYGFGLTAASADPPDSFEVFNFVVTPSYTHHSYDHHYDNPDAAPLQHAQDKSAASSAATAPSSDALARLERSVLTLTHMVEDLAHAQSTAQTELLALLRTPPSSGSSNAATNAAIKSLEKQIFELAHTLQDSHGTVLNDHFSQLSQQIADSHETAADHHEHVAGRLRDYVQHHTPRIGFVVFSFMAFQSACLVYLLWHRYRKSTMPKKFL